MPGLLMNGLGNRSAILGALTAMAAKTPDAVAIHAFDSDRNRVDLTYCRLIDEARAVSTGMAQRGLRRADRVILALPTCAEFFSVYLGCLMSGVVPIVF